MHYEVELKFAVTSGTENLASTLRELGAQECGSESQRDTYFTHPQRDFSTTGEALRVRSCGDTNVITYKGPLLDDQTKTRQELEVACEPGPEAARRMWTMWRALGFRDIRRVNKVRRSFKLTWDGHAFLVGLDDVEQLGKYVEVECLAEESNWQQVRASAILLAERLGLKESERRSYLEMLLEKDPPSS